jgi:hypothetical protein
MYWNYVSCLLTILSTVMVGKRLWHGWMLAGLNSVIICLIGFQTRQWGFIPANIFCLVLYARNIHKWRGAEAVNMALPATETVAAGVTPLIHASDRVSPVVLPFKTPLQEKPRRFRRRGLPPGAELHSFSSYSARQRSRTTSIPFPLS